MQRTAVVTGGSKGIGFSIVQKFLENGFNVISVSRTDGELSKLKSEYPEHLQVIHADLAKKDEVIRAAHMILHGIEQLDILVNNAGIFIPGQLQSEEDHVFELQMQLNVNAAYYISKMLIPRLKQSGDAYIFNMCSIAGRNAYPNGGSYCISKHALLGMSKVLRLELMGSGVLVSAILPGATFTDSWQGTDLPESRFMSREVVSASVWFAWENRKTAVMEEIVLRPIEGDI